MRKLIWEILYSSPPTPSLSGCLGWLWTVAASGTAAAAAGGVGRATGCTPGRNPPPSCAHIMWATLSHIVGTKSYPMEGRKKWQLDCLHNSYICSRIQSHSHNMDHFCVVNLVGEALTKNQKRTNVNKSFKHQPLPPPFLKQVGWGTRLPPPPSNFHFIE